MGLVPRTFRRSFDCIRPGPLFANISIHLNLSSDVLMKSKMLTSFNYDPPLIKNNLWSSLQWSWNMNVVITGLTKDNFTDRKIKLGISGMKPSPVIMANCKGCIKQIWFFYPELQKLTISSDNGSHYSKQKCAHKSAWSSKTTLWWSISGNTGLQYSSLIVISIKKVS